MKTFASHQQCQNDVFHVIDLPLVILYSFVIYPWFLLNTDAGPYFRTHTDLGETRSICLVHCWFHQTIWIRCSKSVIERSKNIQDEPELTSLKVKKFMHRVNYVLISKYEARYIFCDNIILSLNIIER